MPMCAVSILIITFYLTVSSLPVLILYSNQPSLYPLYPQTLCSSWNFSLHCFEVPFNSTAEVAEIVRKTDADIVLDLTDSFETGRVVGELALELHFQHLYSLRQPLICSKSYSIWPKSTQQREVIYEVLRYFNWTQAAVVGSSDPLSVSVIDEMTQINSNIESFAFPSDESQQRLEASLVNTVKSSGRNIILLAADPAFTLRLLQGFRHIFMFKTGYVYVVLSEFLPEGDWSAGYEGVFFLSPLCDESSSDRQTVIGRYLLKVVNETQSHSFQRVVTGYCMWNAQYYQNVKVATSADGRVIASADRIFFPGGGRTPPASLLLLPISIANSTANPTIGPSESGLHMLSSFYQAVHDINIHLGLIPNFELQWTGVEYGFFEFDPDWALAHITPFLGHLGTALIAAPSSSTTIGVSSLLSSRNASLPLIGTLNTSPTLSSPSNFPYFVRVVLSDARLGEVYAQIIKYYGWTHCNVLYIEDDLWTEGVYQTFTETALELGIEISNPESLRRIDSSLDDSHYARQLAAIADTKVRVMVFIVYNRFIPPLLNGLYDLGLEKGDTIFVAVEWLDVNLVTTIPEPALTKVRALLAGAIMTSTLGFRGDFGRKVYTTLSAKGYTPDLSDCVYYDGALMAAHALRYLVQHGKDYEDPNVMIKELRSTKFVGCSGLVYIEEGTNDRARMAFQVYNLKNWPGNETWTMEQVLIFDPESTQIFQKTGDVQWPDGSDLPPADSIPEDYCPDSKRLSPFSKGEALIIGVSLSLLLIISMITGMIWRKWWRRKYPELTTQHEISMEDYIMFSSLVIEFFQVLGMGPEVPGLTHIVTYASQASSLNLESLIVLRSGMYWVVLDAIIAACVLWSLLLAGELLDVYTRWRLSTLESLSERWLPFLGNSCFLPIVSQLTEVFICDRSYDDTFAGSVLANDCQFRCWGATHAAYAAASATLLILWVPAAVFTKPLWQHVQNVLHVKTQPGYLLLATVFQVALIVLDKTVKRTHSIAHLVIYIVMVAGMVAWLLAARPHNYARVNMWHAGMYCAALWMAFISLASQHMQETNLTTILLLTGWGVAACVCIVLQTVKYKSLLYRKPRKDTRKLFRFAFTFWSHFDVGEVDFNKLTTVREVAKTIDENSREFTLAPAKRET